MAIFLHKIMAMAAMAHIMFPGLWRRNLALSIAIVTTGHH